MLHIRQHRGNSEPATKKPRRSGARFLPETDAYWYLEPGGRFDRDRKKISAAEAAPVSHVEDGGLRRSRVCVDPHLGTDLRHRENERGIATPSVTAAAIIHGLPACAAKANAFMPAEPISVPTIAGLAKRDTCLRSLSPMASCESSRATKPRSMPTAMLQASQLSAAVTT